ERAGAEEACCELQPTAVERRRERPVVVVDRILVVRLRQRAARWKDELRRCGQGAPLYSRRCGPHGRSRGIRVPGPQPSSSPLPERCSRSSRSAAPGGAATTTTPCTSAPGYSSSEATVRF